MFAIQFAWHSFHIFSANQMVQKEGAALVIVTKILDGWLDIVDKRTLKWANQFNMSHKHTKNRHTRMKHGVQFRERNLEKTLHLPISFNDSS